VNETAKVRVTVEGVVSRYSGVLIYISQRFPKIPIQEKPKTEEEIVSERMMKSAMQVAQKTIPGFKMFNPNDDPDFRTALWVTVDDYARMGKPTVGDFLNVEISVDREPELPEHPNGKASGP
jgi:hypothetical protein